MEKSKLVILLRTLDVWQLRNLHELVDSPFFNKQDIVRKLLEECTHFLRKGEQVPGLEDMHMRLWPQLQYDHQRLRYVMTDLTRLVEQFLLQRQLQTKPWLQERLLLEGLAARKQEKYFDQSLTKALDKLEKDGFRDADYHYERFRLHQLARGFEAERSEKTNADWLHPIIEDVQTFFLGTRLQVVCDLVSKAGGQVPEGDKALVEELRKRLGKHPGEESPAIVIYETVLQMLTHPDAELYYRKLRMHLRAMKAQFRRDELSQLYGFALNFSIQQLNRGVEAYLNEILMLYREQLDGMIIYEAGIFPPQHFKNIVTVGLRNREYDWTRKFIATESQFLPEADRESIVAYSNAALHYVIGEYAQSRKLLQGARFNDLLYELEGKILLMKSLYELGDMEALNQMCERQLRFLQGNAQLTDRQRNFHSNFVRFLLRLVQFRLGSRTPLGALIGEIEAAREASDLKWLRQKVDEAAKVTQSR
jgi:hypothetical protein